MYRFQGEKGKQNLIIEFKVKDLIDEKIKKYLDSILHIVEIEISTWRKSIEPWDIYIENARNIFGDKWNLFLVSVVAAGIKSRDERYEEYDNFNDKSVSLCKRVRCARIKSGNIYYWEKQLSDSDQLAYKLLVLLVWATSKTIIQLLPILNQKINSLQPEDLNKLIFGMKKVCHLSNFNKLQQKLIEKELTGKEITDSLKYLLGLRFTEENKKRFIYENVNSFSENLSDIHEIKLEYLISKYLSNPNDISLLNEIKKVYMKVNRFEESYYYYSMYSQQDYNKIPIDIANYIMNESKSYPGVIASLAERSCRIFANSKQKSVGEIAKLEKWFD